MIAFFVTRRGRGLFLVAAGLWILSAGAKGPQSYDQPPLPSGYYDPVADFRSAHKRGCFANWIAFKHCRFAPVHLAMYAGAR